MATSGFIPLKYGQLAFVDADAFGGGRDGDGRDLYGYPPSRRREETVADPWGRVVPTPEDILIAAEEGRDADPWLLSETEGAATIDGHALISVNGVPLEDAVAAGLDGENAPPDRQFDGSDGVRCASLAAHALRRIERDGRLTIGSRRAVKAEYGRAAFNRPINWTGAPDPWKRHRRGQYRPDAKPRPL